MAARDILGMLKEAFQDWNEDNAPRLGAARCSRTCTG